MTLTIGARVLTPDMTAGTVEELDEHGMATVRLDAWSGLARPSCCVEWCLATNLRPLPAGYVPRTPTQEDWAEAITFGRAVLDALGEN